MKFEIYENGDPYSKTWDCTEEGPSGTFYRGDISGRFQKVPLIWWLRRNYPGCEIRYRESDRLCRIGRVFVPSIGPNLSLSEVLKRGDTGYNYLHYTQLSHSQQSLVQQFHPKKDEIPASRYWYPVYRSGAVVLDAQRVVDQRIK